MSDEHRQAAADAALLEKFGYVQQLQRTLKPFSAFAVGFSELSMTTGIFSLFAYGLLTGGPAFFWAWPLVFAGQLLVALSFAEVASDVPLAGSLYNWAKFLRGPRFAWFVGWFYIIAMLPVVASVVYGMAPFVADLLGLDASQPGVVAACAVGVAVLQTIINIISVRSTEVVNNTGVVTEIVSMVALALVLIFIGLQQPVGVLFDTAGVQGSGGYLPAFLAASLLGTWQFLGFEVAGEMSEEVINPGRVIPRAILRALTATFVFGGLALAVFILAIPDMSAAMDPNGNALLYIISANLGPFWEKVFVLSAVVAMFICGMCAQAVTSRLIFAYARDGRLPLAHVFSAVSPSRIPRNATLFVGLVVALLTFFSSSIALLVSYAVTGVYLCYLLVCWAAITAKQNGWQPANFNLGGAGRMINLVAVLWLALMIVNLSWPRTEGTLVQVYQVPLATLAIFVVGLAYYSIAQKGRDQAIAAPPRTGLSAAKGD